MTSFNHRLERRYGNHLTNFILYGNLILKICITRRRRRTAIINSTKNKQSFNSLFYHYFMKIYILSTIEGSVFISTNIYFILLLEIFLLCNFGSNANSCWYFVHQQHNVVCFKIPPFLLVTIQTISTRTAARRLTPVIIIACVHVYDNLKCTWLRFNTFASRLVWMEH